MDEDRRKEFRDYLHSSGIVDALTKIFLKMYDEEVKPVNALAYIVKEMIEMNTDGKIDALYFTLQQAAGCKSMLKKYLTPSILQRLRTKTSSHGSSIYDCIRSGLQNLDSNVGIYAADSDCYNTFEEIFLPVIDEVHLGFSTENNVHPEPDYGDADALGDLDPDGTHIKSIRIRCARMIEGYPFNPRMKQEQYVAIMDQVVQVLDTLEGDLHGTFHVLADMSEEQKQQLIDEHFLFKENDKYLGEAAALNYWPVGRGIFLNDTKSFLVWVNEEDHLRIISMQKGGDLGEVYKRFVEGVQFLGERLAFARHPKFGWLSFCPTNLGTSLRASVHIRLPKLSQNMKELNELARGYNLQVRGSRGEHSEVEEGIFDVSNMRRLGLTEFQAVQEMANGIRRMIEKEEELSGAVEAADAIED